MLDVNFWTAETFSNACHCFQVTLPLTGTQKLSLWFGFDEVPRWLYFTVWVKQWLVEKRCVCVYDIRKSPHRFKHTMENQHIHKCFQQHSVQNSNNKSQSKMYQNLCNTYKNLYIGDSWICLHEVYVSESGRNRVDLSEIDWWAPTNFFMAKEVIPCS